MQSWQANFGTSVHNDLSAQRAVAGDFTGDERVESGDLATWREHFGASSGATVRQGDADGDGDVDGADFLAWQRNLGRTAPQGVRILDPTASRDDGDWGYLERGVWQSGALPGGWQGDYRVQPPGTGEKLAEWVTIFPAGEYEVFATWVADSSHATDAKYHIIDGATQLATVVRDQTVAPIDATFNGRMWESLGTYNFTTGVPTVRLTNDASGLVVADGVLFVPKSDCEFDANLTSWRVIEDGGTPTGRGGVSSLDCAAGRGAITSQESFGQWYHDVDGVNQKTFTQLVFSETAPNSGVYVFSDSEFFPIDGLLQGDEGRSHNFHFTLELHNEFTYRGGEQFSFAGDDDLWVYINDRLAIDLGGVHGPESGSVSLDSLGLTIGERYSFDLFFAERHTSASTFAATTSILLEPRDRVSPPTISASAPFSSASAGGTILLSGVAMANGTLANGNANRIVSIEVNGQTVDAFDANGAFFAAVDVNIGENRYHLTAYDAAGQSASTDVIIAGTQAVSAIDFSRYADISGSFSGVYGRTSFQDEADTLYVELATRNDGTFATDVPLLVGVRNITDPSVEVLGADGVTPDGIPYFDFSRFVANSRLAPGETTDSPTIAFHNPDRRRFGYELVFYGKLNAAPIITSVPGVEALVDRPYAYQVRATDEDGDVLAYRNDRFLELGNIDYNAQTPQIKWDWAITFRSMHPSGAHFLMCDASVQYLNEDIDHYTYMARATRDEGEVEGAPNLPAEGPRR